MSDMAEECKCNFPVNDIAAVVLQRGQKVLSSTADKVDSGGVK